jgi:hypothetical protein
MPRTVVGYMGYRAVVMHVFGLSAICDGLYLSFILRDIFMYILSLHI